MNLEEEMQDLRDGIESAIPDMNFARYDALIAKQDPENARNIAEHTADIANNTRSKRKTEYFISYLSTDKCKVFFQEVKSNKPELYSEILGQLACMVPRIIKKKELHKFLDLILEYKKAEPAILQAIAGNISAWAEKPEELEQLIEVYSSDEFRKITETYSEEFVEHVAASARAEVINSRADRVLYTKITLGHCLEDDFREIVQYFEKIPFVRGPVARCGWRAVCRGKLDVLKDVFLSKEFDTLIDKFIEEDKNAEKIYLRGIVYTIGELVSKKNKVAKDLTKLLLEYNDIKVADALSSSVRGTAEITGSTKLSESMLELFNSLTSKPKTTKLAAGYIHTVAQETGTRSQSLIALNIYCEKTVQALVDIYSLLEGKESGVYAEIGQHFIEKKDNPRILLNLGKMINKEKEFLKNEGSETFFPLAVIMSELKRRYISEIKKADELTKLNLARAYTIAKSNKNKETKENYLKNFYEGLEGVLEHRQDMVNVWAGAIVDAFAKKGEKGLLKVES